MGIEAADVLKKTEIVGILERICQALELTASQHELAKSRYEAVGDWLGSLACSVRPGHHDPHRSYLSALAGL